MLCALSMVFGNSGQGCHSGHGGGNGGRRSGRFGHWNDNDNKNSGKSTTDELKFVPFQDEKPNKTTHVAVKEHILNCTHETHEHGDDVVTHIEMNNEDHMLAKPMCGTSGSMSQTKKEQADSMKETLKVEFQEEF